MSFGATFFTEFESGAWRQWPEVQRLSRLLDEALSGGGLETLARQAQAVTRRYFGRTMRLFAPLYLSNECINNCAYCGFSRDNPILRTTLTPAQVEQEAAFLAGQGFRSILLVAGEHPKFVSNGYLEECVRRVLKYAPSVALEVGPMERDEYAPMVRAGAEGLVVYQETYVPEAYAEYHTAGPKKNFGWRLETPERAYDAGFRRLGIGALFGLAPWREEAIALAAHLAFLQRRCWKAFLTVSFPRLRPAAGGFQPEHRFSDRDMAALVCSLRVVFPQVGIVLSTRENAALREALLPLGITHMSAGSHTEPGGYTGVGTEALHRTVKGRVVALENAETCGQATEQFKIADERSAAEVAEMLRRKGYDPVWKDWDVSLTTAAQSPGGNGLCV
jgi:2-iminoacetate synthase